MTVQNKAAWQTAACASPVQIADAPMPSPAADDVTIRVRAVAFNPCDTIMQSKGIILTSYPAILGCDAAGEVVAVGSTAAERGFRVGDRVAGFCDQSGERTGKGAFQLYCNLQRAGKIPDSLAWRDACVVPICLETALVGLHYEECLGLPMPMLEPVDSGKTVLIWGGASSVGSCAVMLAKAAGLKVAATAGAYNLKYLRDLGVDYAIDYRSETAVQDIVAALKGQGEFGGAFTAVMGRDVYFACAEVCIALGGKQTVSTVLPEFMVFEEKLPGGVQIAYNNGPWLQDKKVGSAIWRDWFTPALEKGVLRCKPDAKVVGKGLEDIQKGLDAIANGASATKYVVEL